MGKEKKKGKIGVKTSSFFNKNCSNCNTEYPNWFTQCPQCGTEWFSETGKNVDKEEEIKKKIKIVVKITEEDFNEEIDYIQLTFSGDQGKSWYNARMTVEQDYFIAEMEDVPHGSLIMYFLEVNLVNGEKFVENNNDQYFYYRVGGPIKDADEEKQQQDDHEAKVEAHQKEGDSQEYNEYNDFSVPILNDPTESEEEVTIFGKRQTEINSELKICPHCNSKLKKMWSTCPFCGGNV